MTQNLPKGKQQFLDNNGNPLVGGKVYHYVVGTNTPKDTYQDSGQTTPNTNPVILDARGEASIYGTGNYRQVLQTATGTLVWDQVVLDPGGAASLDLAQFKSDLADPTDPSKGSGLIARADQVIHSIAELKLLLKTSPSQFAEVLGYYAPGDGGGGLYYLDALDTTSADNGGTVIVASDGGRWKLALIEAVSVKQFGAKSDDATAGSINTAAFQAAMDALGSVYVPSGYYTIDGILYWRPGLFMFGDDPGPATNDAQALPGAARLLFTGTGTTCLSQKDISSMLSHGGICDLGIETATRDWMLDWHGTLGFTFSGIRAETTNSAGGGFRSTRIGTNPTWLNRMNDVEIRVPDLSTRQNCDIDWSDSDFYGCAFTGGLGMIDRGPGNTKYVDCIFDRASVSGAGLTLSADVAGNKPTTITTCCFDANDGYGLLLDARLNATGRFSPTIVGCQFRNYTLGVSYEIFFNNDANASAPVMSGAVISGCSFTETARSPMNITESTWRGVVIGTNYYAASWTPISFNSASLNTVVGPNGINIPAGTAMIYGSNSVLSQANVGIHTRPAGGTAGVSLGSLSGVTPFIAASQTTGGGATDLNLLTNNIVRLILAGNGTSIYPFADNAMSLGLSSNRMSVIYAATGTINTSDATEKTDVRMLTDQEVAASKALGKEIGIYKWLASIQEKGADARDHVGMTVQRAIQILQENGLDPFNYGFICYDEWQDEFVDIPEMKESQPTGEKDASGNDIYVDVVVQEAGRIQTRTAGSRYSFRMDELMMFIAVGFERRLLDLEAK